MRSSLNLMSVKSRKRVQVRSCRRLWSQVTVCFALILTVAGVVEWQVCAAGDKEVASAEAEYEPIRQLKIENGRLKNEIKAIQKTEQIPLALAKHQPLLALVGMATHAVSQQQSKLYLKKMEIEREPIDLSSTDRSELTFAIEGVSSNRDAITDLVDALEAVGPFDTVVLNSNSNGSREKPVLQPFSIQANN